MNTQSAKLQNYSVQRKQRGVVLFIALIVLVAMTLAGLALIRSADTANSVAGNFAFKQGTLTVADAGVEAALAALPTIVTTTLDSTTTTYFPTRQAVDAKGVPTTITWSSVPIATTISGYDVQYVIDRLCEGPAPVTDIVGRCVRDVGTGGGTKKAGGIVFSASNVVYYRATIRVTGPRNTSSFVQAIFTY
jgi:Tfp pilus assembly protein PilX